MTNALPLLITGHQPGASGGPLWQTYKNLSQQIHVLADEISKLEKQDDQSYTTIAPFLARSFLELSLCAVLGRLDPFRLLALREIQLQPKYRIGERVLSAIQWTGDILPRDKCSEPWSIDREFSKLPRSLFSEPYEELYWKPSFLALSDWDKSPRGGDWIATLRTFEAKSIVPRLRSELSDVYSSLSKGVHQELLIPPKSFFTRETVSGLYAEAVRLPSVIAVLLSFMENCYNSLAADKALELLEHIQNDLENA